MTNEQILKVARMTLDLGLCHSRTARITRATDNELIAFAGRIAAAERERICRAIAIEAYQWGSVNGTAGPDSNTPSDSEIECILANVSIELDA